MSFDVTQKIRVTNPSANVDWYYGGDSGCWGSIEEALANVPRELRQIGKTVAVLENGTAVEYWWKTGIEDDDLKLKSGLFTAAVTESTYIGEYVGAGESTYVTIPKSLHQKGDNPIVQCYLNNELTLVNITNENGDITVSWSEDFQITKADVLNIYIIKSDKTFTHTDNTPFTVSYSEHQCGYFPFVQVWYDNVLENVLTNITVEDGNVTVGWSENFELEAGKSIVAVFARPVYQSNALRIEDTNTSVVITKKDTNIGHAPVVQCYYDGEQTLLNVFNNKNELIIDWGEVVASNLNKPLVVIVSEDLDDVIYNSNDLAAVAWTGSYDDLVGKPQFVATYSNPNNRKTLLISAAKHKCGAKVLVQCKVNDAVAMINTKTDALGNVIVSWSKPSFISADSPLTVYIFGFDSNTNNVDEKKVIVNNTTNGGSHSSHNHTPEPEPEPQEPEDNKINVILHLIDRNTRNEYAVVSKRFEPNTRIRLTDFDEWNNDLVNKYETTGWYLDLEESDVEDSVIINGKPYEFNYMLMVTWSDNMEIERISGTVEDARYNKPVNLTDITFKNPYTDEDVPVSRWSLLGDSLTMYENTCVMCGDYRESASIEGYLTANRQ